MIEQELIDAFKKLDVNEKRNQISAEFEKLYYLLDSIHQQYGIKKLPSSVKAYNKVLDESMSDEQFFNLIYEDIIFLRKDILTLVNALLRSNDNKDL